MRESIAGRLPSEFESDLFQAALGNLDEVSNPLRFNNFAYSMRELVRHVLSRLAPDAAVLRCDWYREETGRANGISRRQRVYFAVQGGLSDKYVRDELGLDIARIHRKLRDSVDNLSKHTHIEEGTFSIEPERVDELVDETLSSVVGLLDTIDECRKLMRESLWEHIDTSVIDSGLMNTILSIDELATHHWIEEIYTSDIEIADIGVDFVQIVAEGTVSCTLQWGSHSDLRKGDGATLPQSFPFRCKLQSPVDDPSNVLVDPEAFGADTSSWWAGYYD